MIDILPALHSLTGCGSTSKISTKKSALKVAENLSELLVNFGKEPLNEVMISDAEKFLVSCLSSSCKSNTFDELRYESYHSKSFNFNLEQIPPTSHSIRKHIKRAFMQCTMWLNAPIVERFQINPLEFGYTLSEELYLIPNIETEFLPEDFPMPCDCTKCARGNVGPCRKRTLPCCEFCKCKTDECKNPNN